MSWWGVLLILFIGWVLVFLEVFFIPGSFVFAIIGAMTMLTGVVVAYANFGVVEGSLTLLGSAIFTFISIVYGFKSGLLDGFTLRTQNKGKTNVVDESKIKPGDTGIAISKIAPFGKGLFNDVTYEVQSLGEWIVEGTLIEVSKISLNKVYVRAIKSEDVKRETTV